MGKRSFSACSSPSYRRRRLQKCKIVKVGIVWFLFANLFNASNRSSAIDLVDNWPLASVSHTPDTDTLQCCGGGLKSMRNDRRMFAAFWQTVCSVAKYKLADNNENSEKATTTNKFIACFDNFYIWLTWHRQWLYHLKYSQAKMLVLQSNWYEW